MAITFVTNHSGETVAAFNREEIAAAQEIPVLFNKGFDAYLVREIIANRHPLLVDEYLDWVVR